MGASILPRLTADLPGYGAGLNYGHPLFPTYGWIPSMNFGSFKLEELRRRVPTAVFNPSANASHRNLWQGGKARTRAGNLLEYPTAASNTNQALLSWTRLVNNNNTLVNDILPVNGDMSIALGYHPLATLATDFNILGSNTGTGCFNIRGTSGGQVFFNWTLGDPETSASVTFGDDNWVFLQSQDRGVEIWQNGVLVGSQGSFNPRNNDANDIYLGSDQTIFVTGNGQRAQWPYFYCYNFPLTPGQIIHLHKNPFPFVDAV